MNAVVFYNIFSDVQTKNSSFFLSYNNCLSSCAWNVHSLTEKKLKKKKASLLLLLLRRSFFDLIILKRREEEEEER